MKEADKRSLPNYEVENLPVVENNLLRKEHVEYCLGVHAKIGDRQKIIYYKIGSDISTPLLTTNAVEIIGIDSGFTVQKHSIDYVKKYWSMVDQRPTLSPDSIGALNGNLSIRDYPVSKEKFEIFTEDLADRKKRGYWNHRSHLQFGSDRLLFIELKRVGVDPKSIQIFQDFNQITNVYFDWSFPGEKPKQRWIKYLPQRLVGETRRDVANMLKDSDCYYQKGQKSTDTLAIVQDVQPFLKENSIVAVGYQFPFNKNNSEYANELAIALGHWYRNVDISSAPIDNIKIPKDNRELKEDLEYGMKMHVFERRQYPIKKFHYNFGGADYF